MLTSFGNGRAVSALPHLLLDEENNKYMNFNFRAVWLLAALVCLGAVSAAAQKAPKKAPAYKITNIKMVPFNEASGKFEDEISDANPRSFFNDLSMSLFVTFEV